MAKVATREVEGVGAGLRYADVKQVFEAQSNFSEQSQVAKRVKAALDFLVSAIPDGSQAFRSRSLTQSFITMVCHLQKNEGLTGKEAQIAKFAGSFVGGLGAEVEKGQAATDSDFIEFQKSINANVNSGPRIRDKVLLRKLFEFDPDFIGAVDADVAAAADFSGEISKVAKGIREALSNLNDAYASQNGTDLFKATNKTAPAQAAIGEAIGSYEEYKTFIENLYFLFWEGPGSKLSEKPDSFTDINTLRTELQHDTDHGEVKNVEKKKIKHGGVFKKYAGVTSPTVAAPAQFPLLQLALLKALRTDTVALLASQGAVA
jgi:hypothetical protein